jgi:rhamnosyl/mannosyltransferase
MRVLHVYKTYYPDSYGGIEQAIRHLANGCVRHGFDSEVLTCSAFPKKARFRFEEHFVTQVQTDLEVSSTPFSFNAISAYREMAAEFDLINFHYPFPFGDMMSIFSGIDTPRVVTYHSDIIRQRFLKHIYAPVQHIFLQSVDRIICTSEQYLKTSKILQQYENKTEAVSLGLDRLKLPAAELETLKSWKQKLSRPFFLFLGVLRSYKGVETLINAAKDLDAQLVIAGGGPQTQKLKQQAELIGLDNVTFTGRISEDDKAALLELCTALVLPSHLRSEAFGLVQLEASMRQKPLICTELGTGTTHVNEHDHTGLVVPPKNAAALNQAMTFMIENPEAAKTMGKQAEQRYQRLFTAEKMCAEYTRIYNDVLDRHQSSKAYGQCLAGQ